MVFIVPLLYPHDKSKLFSNYEDPRSIAFPDLQPMGDCGRGNWYPRLTYPGNLENLPDHYLVLRIMTSKSQCFITRNTVMC